MPPVTPSTPPAQPGGPITSVGFSLYEGETERLIERMEIARDLGADHVELATENNLVISGTKLLGHRVRKISQAINRLGLEATVHASHSLNLLAPLSGGDLRHLALARACIDFSAAVNARVMVLHPGTAPLAQLDDSTLGPDMLKREEDHVIALANHAASVGVTIGWENLPVTAECHVGERMGPALDPRSHAKRLARLNHPALKATMDLGHAHISARYFGFDMIEALEQLAPYTAHLHLHDNFGLAGQPGDPPGLGKIALGHGDLHLPMGWGDLPFAEIFATLQYPAEGVTASLETGLGGPYTREEAAD
ncbi:MAG: sugar phosphate isomerase/epimerase family protein, partial [Rhodospirillaceae bacterium]